MDTRRKKNPEGLPMVDDFDKYLEIQQFPFRSDGTKPIGKWGLIGKKNKDEGQPGPLEPDWRLYQFKSF
jgi:hypothetical protein